MEIGRDANGELRESKREREDEKGTHRNEDDDDEGHESGG